MKTTVLRVLCLELNDCVQSFVFVYKFCPNELMRFLKIGHWFTGKVGRGGGGEVGGQGIQTSPLPYLKFPPPQTFSLASSLESRFSPCSLRNLEYCCVICRYFPCFPLFPTLFRTPTSRPFLPLHTYTSHPLFAWAPIPSPLRLPHKNCSISFFILVKAF